MANLRILLPALLLVLARPAVAADSVPEYEMKATYLYNFALYTEWPVISGDHFNLCILGPDNFGNSLRRLEGKLLHGKPILLARLSSLSAIRTCHLLFVSDKEASSMPRIMAELGNAPVLVVTDVPVSPRPAVVMSIENQRLLFDVDLQRARAASLTLSSKLLKLARTTN